MRRLPVPAPVLVASLAVAGLAALFLLGRAPLPGAGAADGAVGAKALARGLSDCFLDEGSSRNVRRVSHPSTGVYCLRLAPVAVTNVVASLIHTTDAQLVSAGRTLAENSPCPSTTQVYVVTLDLAGNRAD